MEIEIAMYKTIQITLPDQLLTRVDEAASESKTNRSAFVRQALALALAQHMVERRERLDADGYTRCPSAPGEWDVWEAEQSWGNA